MLDRLRPGSARRRVVREERARLAERLDAESRMALAELLGRMEQTIAGARASLAARVDDANARADRAVTETERRRARLDPDVHVELRRLDRWRRELLALVPEA